MNGTTIVWFIDNGGVAATARLSNALAGGVECFLTEKEAWQMLATRKDADAADLATQSAQATQAANDARAKASKP